ncbi:MAG: serine/threonine-protein kinase, partial [Chloroflexota bacterium]
MEYVSGITLDDYVREYHDGLPLKAAQPLLRGLVEALDYIHGETITHRDLKPSNVILRPATNIESLEPLLMDFGLAVQGTEVADEDVIGTIYYTAPEQIVSDGVIDYRADIYALGVLAYELLTGRRPFDGNVGQVLFSHLNEPPPDPTLVNETVPDEMAQAIMCAMNKHPDQRYPSAGAFYAAMFA